MYNKIVKQQSLEFEMDDSGTDRAISQTLTAFPKSSRLLSTAEANRFLGFAPGYLEKRRIFGGSPRYIQRSPNCAVKYRVEDLEAWEQERFRCNTSEH
jgi:hypothetical protein